MKNRYGCMDYLHNIGSTLYFSTVDAGLIAGGRRNEQGRQSCFFTAVDAFMPVQCQSFKWRRNASYFSIQVEVEVDSRSSSKVRLENDSRQRHGIWVNSVRCHHTYRLHSSRLLAQSGPR